AQDRITDFGTDDILDFSRIDANSRLAGDQGFSLVSAFTRSAGEMLLSFDVGSNRTTVSLDVNGDGVADFALLLDGHTTTTAGWVL
ncbi:MAG: hypothetical protein EON88_32775, partial [Brevundimonas sp.]